MDRSAFLPDLVTKLEPNATVVDVEADEGGGRYRVRVAGTTGVEAACELPRDDIDAATRTEAARRRVAMTLKRCTDSVVAPVPDGRA
jgi:hypothetical protein